MDDNRISEAVHGAFAGWVEERRSTLQQESFTERHAHRQHTLAARDPEAAETAMRDHLKGWWSAWVAQKEPPQDAYVDPPTA